MTQYLVRGVLECCVDISRVEKARERTLTVIMCNIFPVWIQLLPAEFPLFRLLRASNETMTYICLYS